MAPIVYRSNVLELLRNGASEERCAARQWLASNAREALEICRSGLEDPNPSIERAAAAGLGVLGGWLVRAVDDVREAIHSSLKSDDQWVIYEGLLSASELGMTAEPLLASIMGALDHSAQQVRQAALVAIASCGHAESMPVRSAISQGLRDVAFEVRVEAINACTALGIYDPTVRSAILSIGRSEEDVMKVAALHAAARLGGHDEQIDEWARVLMNDTSEHVKLLAESVLNRAD